MTDTVYRPTRWFVARYGVGASTLQAWETKGIVQALRSPGNKRLYDVASVARALHVDDRVACQPQQRAKQRILYVRVSSAKQQQAGDLDRQLQMLQEAYPQHDAVIRDVGSGVNFKRKGLHTLLERAFQGMVREVVVLHKDRLSRFAADLLEYILAKNGAKLVVHRPCGDGDAFGDLADDLLAITTHFVASHNGRRAAAHRQERRERAQEAQGQGQGGRRAGQQERQERRRRERDAERDNERDRDDDRANKRDSERDNEHEPRNNGRERDNEHEPRNDGRERDNDAGRASL